ncbi:uncharacterized protein LOC121410630 [Lytechinus variegatus]|uniref:uncharacterized protein LOC121410630 n=1 Tax=Lytechinus variegatus TaxID=7654 RepID=UPI001BB2B2FF|nr:uncharacterized protein LOC121410630 [Lytechinus variegatus]
MSDSSIWEPHDGPSYVDHGEWVQHSSAWESSSHFHDPLPDTGKTTPTHGNARAEAIETPKRLLSTSSTNSNEVEAQQGFERTTPRIHREKTSSTPLANTTNLVTEVTRTTGVYSTTEPHIISNVGAAQAPPPGGFFQQHRVLIFSAFATSAVILIVVAFLVVILCRSQKKKLKRVKSSEAPKSKGVRRLVKMESQEHTYEEVEIHKKDDIIKSSLDTRLTPTIININQEEISDLRRPDVDQIGKGPFYFKLNESDGQPISPVYSTPILKQTDEFSALTEIEKTGLHRLYSEPIHFNKAKEDGDKIQENIRYSTPCSAPAYFIIDPSCPFQDHEIGSETTTGTTLPRRKLTRQCDVTLEKYDKLGRGINMTSCNGDKGMENSNGLFFDDAGSYNHLKLDQNTASVIKSASPIVDASSKKRVGLSGVFEAKGYNTLAF